LFRRVDCFIYLREGVIVLRRHTFGALLLFGAVALALPFVARAPAEAHVVCGNRVFPATLTMDDPGVGDELSLPTLQYTPVPGGGQNLVYAYEWDKTITQDLGIAINGDYMTQSNPAGRLNGWDNTTITLKDEHPCDEDHELAWSIGVIRELPGTGSTQLRDAGAIDNVGSTAPTFYIGKGFGDSHSDFLRPFAVTGEIGYAYSDSPNVSPNAFAYAASLQYSFPYQQQHVKALKIPDFVSRLVPLVEVSMTSPSVGPTTGTIAPGVLYWDKRYNWQLGIEAVLPANSATRQIQSTGILVQFHLFLDDFANKGFFGKPIIDKNLWGKQ
jgi:hypothetical protein